MMPGRTDLVGELGAENVCLDGRAFRMQRKLDEPRFRFRVLPERNNAGNLGLFGAAQKVGNCELSRLSTAAPPFCSPRKISALASAILASVPKNSKCTGAIAVIKTTSGRASRDSGSISPA